MAPQTKHHCSLSSCCPTPLSVLRRSDLEQYETKIASKQLYQESAALLERRKHFSLLYGRLYSGGISILFKISHPFLWPSWEVVATGKCGVRTGSCFVWVWELSSPGVRE